METRECVACGGKFDTYPCRSKKYCSNKCSAGSSEVREKISKTHKERGITPPYWHDGEKAEEIREKISKSLMGHRPSEDTLKKLSIARKGNKSTLGRKGAAANNWKGGVSYGYRTGYHSVEYIKWREDVFERDNYTCQSCDVKGAYLEAHHLKPFSRYPDLRLELSNGQTLCKSCYRKVDHWALIREAG